MDGGEHEIGAAIIRRGFATAADVRAAKLLQLRAELLKGVTIGVAEALLLNGTITARQFDELVQDPALAPDEAADQCGRLRFGEVAVVLGYLAWAQFEECLDLQQAEDETGLPHRLLGEIALTSGLMTQSAVDRVLQHLVARAYPDPGSPRLGPRTR